MRPALWIAISVSVLLAGAEALPQTKKGALSSRPASGTAAAAKSPIPQASPKKSTASARSRLSRQKSRRSWRAGQQQPSPERYKEIQQALIERGYLEGSPSGTWGAESIDALRRFQQDQNLRADGKINSLSLLALGLGPRQTAAAKPAESEPEP